ncbi:MAG: indolepyruvate ferredoxin oxidoreductase subunit alpha [bacterium]|nr:indolepyruvate ferredoxin oxidoreductase subunit alpha [bacterium]
MKVLLSGNEAVARGAYEAGCNIASAYPGTPSTEILENLRKYKDVYVEWSTNEKVAFDVAVGASFAGARTLVAMKHVGLNVAADPFFTVSYEGVNGGFIVITADDPGMWSSQNEQDNRWYALMAKIPMLEPSDSQEAKDLIKLGFDISEEFDTPLLFRLTTRICHSSTPVTLGDNITHKIKGYVPNVSKFLCLPSNARRWHPIVENRLLKLQAYNEKLNKNIMEINDTSIGIITSGISYQYAREVFPDASFLKLSMTYPLPIKLIKEFAGKVKKIYVIEENDPFLENNIKILGIQVTGKDKIPICGELSQTVLKKSFNISTPEPTELTVKIPERPPVLCPGCPHRGVFYTINKLKLHAMGDIGCYTLGAFPPLNAMETCVCMGASISNAYGIERASTPEDKTKLVAVIGDSTFFHTGVPALINLVYNNGCTTTLILDNLITAMTGHQQHPGTGKTAREEPARKVSIEELVKGSGVNRVFIVDPYNLDELKTILKREVSIPEPSVIIARRDCVLRIKPQFAMKVNNDICTGCKLCVNLGCPALTFKDNKAYIDHILCTGCGLCQQVCVKKSISKEQKC